jgi:hypothetical protein
MIYEKITAVKREGVVSSLGGAGDAPGPLASGPGALTENRDLNKYALPCPAS